MQKLNLVLSRAFISKYRSINKIQLNFAQSDLTILCGANNVGKTNCLRALDLFFSLNIDNFEPERDVPYHIVEGSRGQSYKSEMTVEFLDENTEDIYSITASFIPPKRLTNKELKLSAHRKIKGVRKPEKLTEKEARSIVEDFNFIFVESNNINLPRIVAEIFKEDILTDLDKLRSKQTKSLHALTDFIDKSKEAVSQMEKDITEHFQSFLLDAEGIDAGKWTARIKFPEFAYLREAISQLVDFTIYDTNDRELSTKGSGIQRMVLLALIRYLYENAKGNVIWAIDEPEAFLQPSLQKRVFKELKALSDNISIVLTTHSQHFVDIAEVEHTYLLETKTESVEYRRVPDRIFDRISTEINGNSGIGKVEAIRHHIGIQRNDAWNVVPSNLIVEGSEDRDYLTSLFSAFDLDAPNILIAGGATKIKGYLQFLKEFVNELEFKPKVVAIFDHDSEGRSEFESIESRIGKQKYDTFELAVTFIPRCDGNTDKRCEREVEDFMYSSLIIDAANSILRKKGYKKIRSNQRKTRFDPAFNQTGILSFITQVAQSNNTDKEPLNFENDGIKLLLCKETVTLVSQLSGSELRKLDTEQPEVLKFLRSLLSQIAQ